MKRMLEITHKFLQEHKTATLDDIFSEVKRELKPYWKQGAPETMMAKIEVDKLGALYAYLTTDGRFVMLDQNTWTINTQLTSKELAAAKSKVIVDNVEKNDYDFND